MLHQKVNESRKSITGWRIFNFNTTPNSLNSLWGNALQLEVREHCESNIESLLVHMLHISIAIHDNKQLLDEFEHDIMNYQCRGLSYWLKPKLRLITQIQGWWFISYHAKIKVSNCFIVNLSKILQKKTLLFEFEKFWKHHMFEGLGN